MHVLPQCKNIIFLYIYYRHQISTIVICVQIIRHRMWTSNIMQALNVTVYLNDITDLMQSLR